MAAPASIAHGNRQPPAGHGGQARGTARRLATALFALLVVAVWVWGAHALLRSSVPARLHLPHVDPRSYFSADYLHRAASYERFLDVDGLLAGLTVLAVLAWYARWGTRLMSESAAGPIGTGMMLGMLGYGLVWLAEVPFGLVAVWWERRHGISHQGYLSYALGGFLGLGWAFLIASLGLLIAMALARAVGRWWWALAAPAFAAFALLAAFLGASLIGNTHPVAGQTAADVRVLASREGIAGTKAVVQDVGSRTTAPNAESVGFGSTRRVILWSTLLDGRFDRREVAVVIGHELGHLAHHHPPKRVGWLLLFLLPATALVAWATRRRGGLGRPEAVPLALLVFVVLQFLAAPLLNVVYRREEAEADWSALRATEDPQSARSLFVKLTTTSLDDPDPPTWAYVLFDNHPSAVQRIAMVDAWQREHSR